ncbi:hypothetical protein K449DRAFT_438860 [Hypoxylon sp. EC38]|nr:hypothetical protein K449DRAFT_438860 [Hypoxylon sp. EC38]
MPLARFVFVAGQWEKPEIISSRASSAHQVRILNEGLWSDKGAWTPGTKVMPSRRTLPDLRIFSRRSIVIPSTFQTQLPIRPSSTCITPPARLHLRNILPTSPGGMPTPPPPPRRPYPWLWHCHSCDTVYQLACTRRCLVCGHEYCVSADPPKVKRGKKRRRSSAMCTSEFDYLGWAEWGAWRRKVLGLEVMGPEGEMIRERAFVNNKHNCELDCDFPSECHHVRHRVKTEGSQSTFQSTYMETVEEEPEYTSTAAEEPLRYGDELPLVETVEMEEEEEGEDEDNGGEKGEEEVKEEERNLPDSPTIPKSPLSQSSFLWDDSDEEEKEKEKEKEKQVAGKENTERKEKKRKTKSRRKSKESGSTDSSVQENSNSPAVDTKGMDPEELRRLLEEDKGMMPLELLPSDVSNQQQESERCEHGRPKHGKKLTVRNPSDADKCEDSDSSDSGSDGNSSPSSPPPSSASSLDGEWVPASDQKTPAEDGDLIIDQELEDELAREMEEMINATTSTLQNYLAWRATPRD